ncbi:MAG: 4-vinyl reductase [Lachnospiraceae bacterium]|nr:4-vinyl reductase [Lachnospiraceae bacterium]
MEKNVFLEERKELELSDYMHFQSGDRGNLGGQVPVMIYRLLEYSIREQLVEQYSKEEQIQIFRKAGYRAGVYFAEHFLDLSLPFSEFIAHLQACFQELKVGILRIEKFDRETGKMILTISEDVDCSGLPMLGETVCNYDEGILSGILTSYTKKDYNAIEIDCWATGDRVCRFQAETKETAGE